MPPGIPTDPILSRHHNRLAYRNTATGLLPVSERRVGVDEAVRAFVVAALIIVLGLLGILGNAEVGASQTQVVVQSVEVESAVADAAR